MKSETPLTAQTQRLASLGFMLARVCHEVSNPLAAVSSMLQILQSKRGITPETLEKGLASIAANVARVRAITKKLGDFSRVGDEAAPLAIDEAVEAAAALLRHSPCADAVALEYHGLPGVSVMARPGELQQVVFNIFLNAAQAMQGTGRIEARARAAGTQLELTIRDSGDRTAGAPAAGSGGHGLIGMRERAALFGGTLSAGPCADHGFEVHASLPYGEAAR